MPDDPIERPISFTALMARAILDGRKTQTRRIATDDECPLGAAGDRLWVREPFTFGNERIIYGADLVSRSGHKWRASYLMKRNASRSLLKITSIRSERLREISERDAIAEGCPTEREDAAVQWFADLWDRIAKEPAEKCEANPLVWVIEFRVIT